MRAGGPGGLALEYSERRPHSAFLFLQGRAATVAARMGGTEHTVLGVRTRCVALGQPVALYLHLRDHDALRGALKPDARGRTLRGDLAALERLLAMPTATAPPR